MPKFIYCVSCNTGKEEKTKYELKQALPEATVMCPSFDRKERKRGTWSVKTYILIPGYLFIYSEEILASDTFYSMKGINRLVGYVQQDDQGSILETKAFTEADFSFARWLYDQQGHIRLSQAMLVGDKTKIISGPLLDYEGEIIRINRQRQSALVSITICGTEKKVWLSFHWMMLKDGKLIEWER